MDGRLGRAAFLIAIAATDWGCGSGGENWGTSATELQGGNVTIVAQHSGKCIDALAGEVIQRTCNGAASQNWIFRAIGGGYQIASVASPALCLVITGGSNNLGALATMSTCSQAGVPGEVWLTQAHGSNFRLIVASDNQCMDVDGVSTADGATVSQWTCVDQSNEFFAINTPSPAPDSGTADSGTDGVAEAATPDAGKSDGSSDAGASVPTGSPVSLTLHHSGKCVDIVSGNVLQETCNGAPTQRWIFNPVVGGYQIVSAANSTLCMNLPGASATLGAKVALSSCSSAGVAGEIWNPRAQGNYFFLVATHDGQCMSVAGASSADGATMSQWTCVNQGNELFAVSLASPTADAGGADGAQDAAQDAANDGSQDAAQDAAQDASIQDATTSDAGLGTDAAVPIGAPITIVAKNSGKCFDIVSSYVLQETCTGVPSQTWVLRAVAGGYQIEWAPDPTRCVNVPGASSALAAKAVVSTCSPNGVPGEIWNLQASAGNFLLVAAHDNLCLSVDGAQMANGGTYSQWTCVNATNEMFAIAAAPPPPDPAVNGGWSTVIDLPSVPVAAAVLSSGQILTWASWQPDNWGNPGDLGQTYTAFVDPQALTVSGVLVTKTSHDMFCPGTTLLGDGRVFVNGGGPDVANTSIYDGTASSWAPDALMNQIRWYASSVTLPDGRVFTLGGNRLSGQSGTGEIWTPGVGWKYVPNAVMAPILTADPVADSINRSEEHPRLFVAPNGKIFVPGPTPNMQWYDLAGNGTIASAGPRGDDAFSQNDATVMFDVGKILKAGGNPNYGVGSADQSPSSRASYVIDINGGGIANVTKVAPMIYARAYATGVVLPDGTVMVAGGLDNGAAFTDKGAIFAPEIFDPSTQTWRGLAPMALPRAYHSVALLIPDGRVFVGGGGLCGHGCLQNHADAQFFSPPYLFQAGRPQIKTAPSSVSYASVFPVTTTGNTTRFTWVRMSSVTHTVNTDQRWLPAASTALGGGSFSVAAPANGNVAPPGNYMLFALNGGVPSVAAIVRVGP